MEVQQTSWLYFSTGELECHHCQACWMDEQFMTALVKVRVQYRKPMILTSAYRCAEHNSAVSNGPTGPHVAGRAVDIKVYGPDAVSIIELGLRHGLIGIGVSQKGPIATRFIHLDNMRRRIWSD